MNVRDSFCSASYPAPHHPIRCTLGRNHTGPHASATRKWTDTEAEELSARAEAAADDAAQTARNAVLSGQRVGPVSVGRNRSEKRAGMGRGR